MSATLHKFRKLFKDDKQLNCECCSSYPGFNDVIVTQKNKQQKDESAREDYYFCANFGSRCDDLCSEGESISIMIPDESDLFDMLRTSRAPTVSSMQSSPSSWRHANNNIRGPPTHDSYSDNLSREYQFASMPPSEFSVESVYKRMKVVPRPGPTPRPVGLRRLVPPADTISYAGSVRSDRTTSQSRALGDNESARYAQPPASVNGDVLAAAVSESSEDTREDSPSRDSGVQDMSFPLLEKEELGATTYDLGREMTTLVHLTQDFLRDVIEEKEMARELIDEIQSKIRPFLITLDEEMTSQEKVLRQNLDSCSISDPKVTWLLQYTRYMQTFRSIFTTIGTEMIEDFEKALRLRERGCAGMGPEKKTVHELEDLRKKLTQTQISVQKERLKSEAAYE